MVTRWDPFAEAMSLRDAMNRLFETSVVRPTSWAGVATNVGQSFPLNIYTRDENLIVEALLPGVSPEDVQVSVDQGVLSIAAKRQGVPATDGQESAQQPGWYLREIVAGQFRRAFSLPFPVDADKAQATYTDGVLTLTLPKAEAARPRQIRIEAGAPQIEATSAQ
jgi:HSP20 family protein